MRTNTFIHYSRSNFLLVQTTVVLVMERRLSWL